MKKPPCIFVYPQLLLQALLVADSPHAWLLAHCRHGHCRPITLAGIVRRILRTLQDPVFQLSDVDRSALLAELLPRLEILDTAHFERQVQIVVSDDILVPGADEDTGICYATPELYGSLLGLQDDPEHDDSLTSKNLR